MQRNLPRTDVLSPECKIDRSRYGSAVLNQQVELRRSNLEEVTALCSGRLLLIIHREHVQRGTAHILRVQDYNDITYGPRMRMYPLYACTKLQTEVGQPPKDNLPIRNKMPCPQMCPLLTVLYGE